ncbi:hypothetical protein QBC39DRAFT_41254 [Podospora conica]|nr:hypothetical protein QBC39DRAFT_41254 [Schizothecium conicum]
MAYESDIAQASNPGCQAGLVAYRGEQLACFVHSRLGSPSWARIPGGHGRAGCAVWKLSWLELGLWRIGVQEDEENDIINDIINLSTKLLLSMEGSRTRGSSTALSTKSARARMSDGFPAVLPTAVGYTHGEGAWVNAKEESARRWAGWAGLTDDGQRKTPHIYHPPHLTKAREKKRERVREIVTRTWSCLTEYRQGTTTQQPPGPVYGVR